MPENKLSVWSEVFDARDERRRKKQELTDADIEIMQRIIQGDTSSGIHFHKLAGTNPPVYSAYVDHTRRLLFIVKGSQLILIGITQHQYNTTHALQPGVAERFYQNNDVAVRYEPIANIKDFIPTPTYQYQPPDECVSYHEKFIILDDTQQTALSLQTPAVIIGDPGSGKSSICSIGIAMDLENAALLEENRKIVYFTESPGLVLKMENAWTLDYPTTAGLPEANQVIFTNYANLLKEYRPDIQGKECIGEREFQKIMGERVSNKVIRERHSFIQTEEFKKVFSSFYHEIQLMVACLTKEKYLAISHLPESIQSWAYEEFDRYLKKMAEEDKCYDPNLLVWEPAYQPFSRVYHDEALSASPVMSLMLHRLTKNANVVYFADPNQDNNMTHEVSHLNYLLRYLGVNGEPATKTELGVTYRLPPTIADLANEVLAIKQNVNGGLNEKAQSSRVQCLSREAIFPGTLEWFKHENIKALIEKSNNKVYVVITYPEYIEEAKKEFGDNVVVCTVDESRGQEFEEAVLYRMTDPQLRQKRKRHQKKQESLLQQICKKLITMPANFQNKANLPKHESDRRFEAYMNSIYIAVTRIICRGYIVEKGDPTKNALHQRLLACIEKSMAKIDLKEERESKLDIDSMLEKAKQDLREGNLINAEAGFLKAGKTKHDFERIKQIEEGRRKTIVNSIKKARIVSVQEENLPEIEPLSEVEKNKLKDVIEGQNIKGLNLFLNQLKNRKQLLSVNLDTGRSYLYGIVYNKKLRKVLVDYLTKIKSNDVFDLLKNDLNTQVVVSEIRGQKKTEALITTLLSVEGKNLFKKLCLSNQDVLNNVDVKKLTKDQLKIYENVKKDLLKETMPLPHANENATEKTLEPLSLVKKVIDESIEMHKKIMALLETEKKAQALFEVRPSGLTYLVELLRNESSKIVILSLFENGSEDSVKMAATIFKNTINRFCLREIITEKPDSELVITVPVLFHLIEYHIDILNFRVFEGYNKKYQKEELAVFRKPYRSVKYSTEVNLITLIGLDATSYLPKLLLANPGFVKSLEWHQVCQSENDEPHTTLSQLTELDGAKFSEATSVLLKNKNDFYKKITLAQLVNQTPSIKSANSIYSDFDYLSSVELGAQLLELLSAHIVAAPNFREIFTPEFLSQQTVMMVNDKKFKSNRFSKMMAQPRIFIKIIESTSTPQEIINMIIEYVDLSDASVKLYMWSMLSNLIFINNEPLHIMEALIKNHPDIMKNLPDSVWHAPITETNQLNLKPKNYALLRAMLRVNKKGGIVWRFVKTNLTEAFKAIDVEERLPIPLLSDQKLTNAENLLRLNASAMIENESTDVLKNNLSDIGLVRLFSSFYEDQVTVLECVMRSEKLSTAFYKIFYELCVLGDMAKLINFIEHNDINQLVVVPLPEVNKFARLPFIVAVFQHAIGRNIMNIMLWYDPLRIVKKISIGSLTNLYRSVENNSSSSHESLLDFLKGTHRLVYEKMRLYLSEDITIESHDALAKRLMEDRRIFGLTETQQANYRDLLKNPTEEKLRTLLQDPQAYLILLHKLDDDRPLFMDLFDNVIIRPLLINILNDLFYENPDHTLANALTGSILLMGIEINRNRISLFRYLLEDDEGYRIIKYLENRTLNFYQYFPVNIFIAETYSDRFRIKIPLMLTASHLRLQSFIKMYQQNSGILGNLIPIHRLFLASHKIENIGRCSVFSNWIMGGEDPETLTVVKKMISYEDFDLFKTIRFEVWAEKNHYFVTEVESFSLFDLMVFLDPFKEYMQKFMFRYLPHVSTSFLAEEVTLLKDEMPRLYYLVLDPQVCVTLSQAAFVTKPVMTKENGKCLHAALVKRVSPDHENYAKQWNVIAVLSSSYEGRKLFLKLLLNFPELVQALKIEDFQHPNHANNADIVILRLLCHTEFDRMKFQNYIRANPELYHFFETKRTQFLEETSQTLASFIHRCRQADDGASVTYFESKNLFGLQGLSLLLKQPGIAHQLSERLPNGKTVFSMALEDSVFFLVFQRHLGDVFDGDDEKTAVASLVEFFNQNRLNEPAKLLNDNFSFVFNIFGAHQKIKEIIHTLYTHEASDYYYKSSKLTLNDWRKPFFEFNRQGLVVKMSHLDLLLSHDQCYVIAEMVIRHHLKFFRDDCFNEAYLFDLQQFPGGFSSRAELCLRQSSLHFVFSLYLRQPNLPYAKIHAVLMLLYLKGDEMRVTILQSLIISPSGRQIIDKIVTIPELKRLFDASYFEGVISVVKSKREQEARTKQGLFAEAPSAPSELPKALPAPKTSPKLG